MGAIAKYGVSALACFAVLLLGGCAEPLTAYRTAGHDPEEASTILVLPFLDSRTFRDDDDEVNGELHTIAREFFTDAMRRHSAFRNTKILTPAITRDGSSLTHSEILALGREYGAELVVDGQVFSYTDTRAASIPPRAGMFVRIFSVREQKLVFVGDHYQAAGAPGSSGGRERQAREVAANIILSYAGLSETLGDEEMAPVIDQEDEIAATLAKYREDESGTAGPEIHTAEVKLKAADGPSVLVLPFHERENPNNLIEKTGGGAVVSGIYAMELAKLGQLRLMFPQGDAARYDRLLTVEESLALARAMGADYVLRGEVVEFRRAMSVPSWYSMIISTAILAAQILFAEQSGVDIAIEVWRVQDGMCVYAQRDISHQKYVVQAEKTVRRLAADLVPLLAKAMTDPGAVEHIPEIDAIVVKARRGRPATRDGQAPSIASLVDESELAGTQESAAAEVAPETPEPSVVEEDPQDAKWREWVADGYQSSNEDTTESESETSEPETVDEPVAETVEETVSPAEGESTAAVEVASETETEIESELEAAPSESSEPAGEMQEDAATHQGMALPDAPPADAAETSSGESGNAEESGTITPLQADAKDAVPANTDDPFAASEEGMDY